MPFIETADKTTLFYNDWGSGRPVVLIHGWPLNADMWEYQSVFLASQGLRVIAYDRRGFGRSSQPWSGYDYDTMADDLKSILDTLDLTDAVLVGFSMGGGEVARYMGRHRGERVAKAALISAVTPCLLRGGDNPDGVDRGTFDKMIDGLRQDRPHFLATFGKQFFGAGLLNFTVTTEILQWALMMAMTGSPKATLDCVRAFSETDFRQDMAAFRVPTLIVHGDADATVPVDKSGRVAASMIPGSVLKEYAGAPHALFFTEKDKLNQDLLAFIRG
ncbi:alpha/beta fold hydrolase [Rhodopila sp.]|uniref:alpha/beta fold hydrolase n=1 Tax=Rhodopila sp. TaxID=2480087 RepID=UPI003D0986CA